MKREKKCWVVKVGSSVLGGSGEVNLALINQLSKNILRKKNLGSQVVLVTSGAISQGMKSLNISNRPNSISKLQALAAIGQIKIISSFSQSFDKHGLSAAQILLTADDLRDRQRYLNAKNTIKSLVEQGVVPIVNENDTISTESIRFGDNDTLAALVANLLSADYLLLLTDQEGLYDKNPDKYKDARLIKHYPSNSFDLDAIQGLDDKSVTGSGGMRTKINAVKTAARSGTHTVIASGFRPEVVDRVFEDPSSEGTFFEASISKEKARKLWLGFALKPTGTIIVNQRAAKALLHSASLLAVGITEVQGNFLKGDLVMIAEGLQGGNRIEVARGITNYSHSEIDKIKGMNSERILNLFNFQEQEVVHRDNMLIAGQSSLENHL